jgi:L-serine dehydratase
MEPIDFSIFELFKIGPGPSSSHTIGPMRASYDFLLAVRALPAEVIQQAGRFDAELMGSLAATGQGHGTKSAVLAGLLGFAPDNCPPGLMDALAHAPSSDHRVDLGPKLLPLAKTHVYNALLAAPLEHPNTLVLRLLDTEERILFEREYYSIGGGFIRWKGDTPAPRGAPVHRYNDAVSLAARLREKGLGLDRLVLENEMAITGADEKSIRLGLDKILRTMEASVERGLRERGVLPGPIGLHRKAAGVNERANRLRSPVKRFLAHLNAYAFAASEENAAGQPSVTAPTLGSCGVVPAANHALKHHMRASLPARRRGLLAAAAIGFLVMKNASIAGAEVGCQGEVGVASSMAAAMFAQAMGLPVRCVLNAAESALEHHLGLTCDPVAGYVQVPCVERNVMGAVKAFNAYLLSEIVSPEWHKVDLDKTIRAMAMTGKDMCSKYKETSQGGLAAIVHC